MTPDRDDETPEVTVEHGILSDATSVDTAGIGLIGPATAQFSVVFPSNDDDDLDDDDDVIGDEIHLDEIATGDIILEDLPAADEAPALEEIDEEPEASGLEIDVDDISSDSAADDAPSGDPTAIVVDAAGSADASAMAEPFAPSTPAAATSEPEPAAVLEAAPLEPAAAPAAVPPVAPAPVAETVPAAETAPAVAAPVAPAGAAEPAPVTASVPTTRREAHNTGAHARLDRAHAVERVHPPEPEVVLASKRLGEFESGRESPDLLTADRLLDRGQLTKPEPEGLWPQLVYSLSRHRINLGDGRRARARKALDRRISASLSGGARFVPVLSRKGGVGKTTVTALLGMALADARDDRVIAVDANPDRGTLADRISRTSTRTVRDLVRTSGDVAGYSDISALVARDETRLDVLSSDPDPRVSEAFNDEDYRDVAVLAARFYSLVLTDTGTGIVHSVMGATLEMADQIVVVAGLSVDEARLASETLTWLETNGYAEQVRHAVVVLNNARPGAPLVRESELEAHFRTRVRAVVRVPYDTAIGTGSAIVYRDLQPATRQAARELAASVIEGLRASQGA
ncbi:MinD/ParA family protein [Microbacterium sp. P04]|uniref:MinD/ParA family ATP-binding protein n=1 Tax=Microbacterium sp. P04 TaxID=3366947 RepID=UPI00374646C4